MFFKSLKVLVLLSLLLNLSFSLSYAQNVLDPIEEEDKSNVTINHDLAPKLYAETIKTISPSKKIFILTNNNESFSKGDFISLLLTNKLVCRALVAKTTSNKLSGIKIVKIYNLSLWKLLKQNNEVLVLKGDDSYYNILAAEKTSTNDKKDNPKSQSEMDDDLFSTPPPADSEDDLSLDEASKRLIKPDNLISINIGLISGLDVDGSTKKYTHINGDWAYQLSDNIWAEAGIGTNTIRDFPFTGLDTTLINFEVKAKYTFNAPFGSVVQPYLGYQVISASSPGSGTDPGDGSRTVAELEEETRLVASSKKSSLVLGLTILKRLVPGWFIRADIGTDIINGGLSIEF